MLRILKSKSKNETQDLETVNTVPSFFSIDRTSTGTNAIFLDCLDATDAEEEEILNAIYISSEIIQTDLAEFEFSNQELDACTAYEIRIVASDAELTSEITETISTEEEPNTSSSMIALLGEGNVQKDTPILEGDFGTLSLRVKLTNENGEPVVATEELRVDFRIESDKAFQFDYVIKSFFPLQIEEGESEAIIEVEVFVDNMLELEDKSFTIIIESVNPANPESEPTITLDEANVESIYIIAQTEE